MEIPLWLFESELYAHAAFIFCTLIVPLMYWLGWRGAAKKNFALGTATGYNRAFNELANYRQGLTFRELVDSIKRRQVEWGGKKPCEEFDVIELFGECGEVANAIKKRIRFEAGMAGGVEDLMPISEEIGDVVICAIKLAMHYGIDPEFATIDKFNKTSDKHSFKVRLPERA